MKLEIGTRVNVQGRFNGVITKITENKHFPYTVKMDGTDEYENCAETELYEVEEV